MIISTVITRKKYDRQVLERCGFDEDKKERTIMRDIQGCLQKVNDPEVRRRTFFIYTVAGSEDNKPLVRDWDDEVDRILMPLQFAVSRN